MIIFIVIYFIMIFFPFPMSVSVTYIPKTQYYISYFTFMVHITVEVLYCVLFLYIISLLEFIGTKKFVQASFYIHLFVGIFLFIYQIINFFWQQPFEYYSFLSIVSLLSVLYLVTATFWIKNPVLYFPFRIYGLSLLFMFGLNVIYARFVIPTNIDLFLHSSKPNYYKYGLNVLSLMPLLGLLYILIKSNKLFNMNEMHAAMYVKPNIDE